MNCLAGSCLRLLERSSGTRGYEERPLTPLMFERWPKALDYSFCDYKPSSGIGTILTKVSFPALLLKGWGTSPPQPPHVSGLPSLVVFSFDASHLIHRYT